MAGGGGIAALNEEGLDNAMEDGVVVVTVEAELDEVPDGFGGLLRPELDVQRPAIGLQYHLPPRRRLQYVDRRHCNPSVTLNFDYE